MIGVENVNTHFGGRHPDSNSGCQFTEEYGLRRENGHTVILKGIMRVASSFADSRLILIGFRGFVTVTLLVTLP